MTGRTWGRAAFAAGGVAASLCWVFAVQGAAIAPPEGNGGGNGNGGGGGGGGGGDGGDGGTNPTPWMLWIDPNPDAQDCTATDPNYDPDTGTYCPIAPWVEGMDPQLNCVIDGENGELVLAELYNLSFHFNQNFDDYEFPPGEGPCPGDCRLCGANVWPMLADGSPAEYDLERQFAIATRPDGAGGIEIKFFGSGLPPGARRAKRYTSNDDQWLPVKELIIHDPNDPAAWFTLVIREPMVPLYPQSGPGGVFGYISIGDLHFQRWQP